MISSFHPSCLTEWVTDQNAYCFQRMNYFFNELLFKLRIHNLVLRINLIFLCFTIIVLKKDELRNENW